jgi:hypothetical protein
MACIELAITPLAPAAMTVTATPGASIGLTPGGAAEMELTAEQPAALDMQQAGQAEVEITLVGGAELTLGEVCNVSGGTLVVLAGSDGPFRTKGGGYFLLDPAKNPPED